MSVGAVLLLLFLALSWLARRVPGGRLGARGERVMLTNEHVVHVVEIAGMRLLVGTGPSGAPRVLASLGEIEGVETQAASESGRSAWGGVLDRFGVVGGR